MQEIAVKIRFNRVCLGAAKRKRSGQTVYEFDHDPNGSVMFMPSAWAAGMRYAAKLANRHHAAVKNVDWCPVVVGMPRQDWRRTVVTKVGTETRSHFVVHEAFPPGETVTLSAVLPDELPLPDFQALLELVGKYRGFSPFNNAQEKYGTFEVISVTPVGGPGFDAS